MALLRALDALLKRHSSEILQAIQSDFESRSIVESWLFDIRPVRRSLADHIRRLKTAAAVEQVLGSRTAARINDSTNVGVGGFVPAWHFPVSQSFLPVIEAIASGNRAVLALPHQTPSTSDSLKRIVGDVFSAEHVVAVTGGENVASAFARLPLDWLQAATQWPQARSASLAAGSQLVPLSLAVPGRGVVVVTRGYSLDLAAQHIMRSKLFNAGQHPSAPDIVYVPRGAVGIFLGYARHAFAAMYPSLLWNPDYGSMVSVQHADEVRFLIEDAIDRGAQIIRANPGGESLREQKRKIAPTLVVEVGDEMAALRQPILGPVLAVRTYQHLEEVIELASAGNELSSLCWFDVDADRADGMIPRMSSRRAWLNAAPPFGSALATVLPPLLSGDSDSRNGFGSGDARFPIRSTVIDRMFSVRPPYGGMMRTLSAWRLGARAAD